MQLANQTFFRPRLGFIDWLASYAGQRLIVDCGAGQGYFAKKLLDRGLNVLALDLNYRSKTYTQVVECDCTSFQFPRNSLPILARPCHGQWVMDTVEQALSDWGSRRCSAVLYISKPENLWRDIEYSQRIQVMRRVDNAGRDHESVYEISNTIREAKEEWVLIQPSYWDRPSWVEDLGDDYWHNLAGGRCPKGKNDKVLERKMVASYRDLDWRDAYHVEGSDSGWLSPTAEFYPCESRAHDTYADLVLHSTPDALDK